jgi:type I restriction enzyme S subunit
MQYGKYPIYGATGIIAYSEKYQIKTNAILIIKDGASIGRVQFVREKASIIGTLNYLLANENVSLEYIFYCLKYFNFSKFKVGSGIPHIYFRDYGEAMIYCPSYDEQVKVSTLLVSLEGKFLIEMEILKKMQVQKQYLLGYLFI